MNISLVSTIIFNFPRTEKKTITGYVSVNTAGPHDNVLSIIDKA